MSARGDGGTEKQDGLGRAFGAAGPSVETQADADPAPPKALLLDVKRYEAYLANSDLSDQDREEFLQALWSIVVEFVALGWGVHPLQQAQDCCGQTPKSAPVAAFVASAEVDLEDSEIDRSGDT